MRFTVVTASATVVALAVSFVGVARADDPALVSSYHAPTSCPSGHEFTQRVHDAELQPRLGVVVVRPSDRTLDVIIDAPTGTSGRLVVRGGQGIVGTREVIGKDCQEVVEQLLLAVALAAATPPDGPAPPPQPSPPSASPVVASRAAERPVTEPETRPSWRDRREVTLSMDAGVFSDQSQDFASFFASAQVLYRSGLFVIGGAVDAYGDIYPFTGAAALTGVSLPSPRWLRIDLLGMLGANYYASRPDRPFDAGYAGNTIGFLGGRASVTVEIQKFSFGASALFTTDLDRLARSWPIRERFAAGPVFGGTFGL